MDVQGSIEARFEPVRQCFAEILEAQVGTGAAFAAWSDGRWVVDLWGGYADLGRREWDALENALRDCLGVPHLPGGGQ